ncbi:AMP-binding protein [Hoeflea sp. CAU 1731]
MGIRKWKSRIELLPAEMWASSGDWEGKTIATRLDALCASDPDTILFVDGDETLTAKETRDASLRLCSAFERLGLRPGDVVSFQLPNWREVVFVDLACAYGGFVCNPIVPIYREAEVKHIIEDAGSALFLVPHRFRNFDYIDMARRIGDKLGHTFRTVVVRPEGVVEETRFDDLLDGDDSGEERPPVDANSIKLLMYTSGTTGRAKGVLHSHNTIGAEIGNFIRYLGMSGNDVILMPSPLSHITGYLYGIQLPITLGAKAVLMDAWEVGRATELIDQHQVTFTIGATPFLQELASFAKAQGRRLPSMRYFASGGAPVPPEIVERANAAMENCAAFRVYGSTEAPTVTLGVPQRERARLAATTEGFVVGHDIRLVDLEGKDVSPGEEGEIITRGPEVCLGYTLAEHNDMAFDSDGYFYTGDLAMMTDEGCLVITGRKKDLIIRGGENLSPKEIEDEIYKLDAVKEAAVVAMPHARLGETGCAFVVLQPGKTLSFGELVESLDRSGLARQKFPERLEIVSEVPYTAAGKVRKDMLRKIAYEFAPAGKAADENG